MTRACARHTQICRMGPGCDRARARGEVGQEAFDQLPPAG